MHKATVRGFDIREAVFARLDACNRKLKAELLLDFYALLEMNLDSASFLRYHSIILWKYPVRSW